MAKESLESTLPEYRKPARRGRFSSWARGYLQAMIVARDSGNTTGQDLGVQMWNTQPAEGQASDDAQKHNLSQADLPLTEEKDEDRHFRD